MRVSRFIAQGKYAYWRFSFNDATQKPKKKFFTFSCDKYSKKEVEAIAYDYLQAQKKGWNPWSKDDPMDYLKGDVVGERTFMLMDEGIKEFLGQTKDSVQPVTYKSYKSNLELICTEMGNPYLHTITSEEVEEVINDNDTTYSTKLYRQAVFRQFNKFAVRHHWMKKVEPKVKSTKKEKRKKNRTYLTQEQLLKLIEHIEQQDFDLERKTLLKDLIQVLFYQGLRINEALNMKRAWFDQEMKLITIGDKHGWPIKKPFIPKSGKIDHPIPVPKELHEIYYRRASMKGMYEQYFNITYGNFQPIYKKLLRGCFDKHISETNTIHTLRDSCATYWLNERRINVVDVQRMLRHSNINVTMRYIHYDAEATYNAFNR